MPKTHQVIIAGAGPVGLVAALALVQREVSVLVLEAEPGLTRDLRAGSFHLWKCWTRLVWELLCTKRG